MTPSEMIEISIRAPERTVVAMKFIGNEGVNLILHIAVLVEWAEEEAGHDDQACFNNLLEVLYLTDVLDEYIRAKERLTEEAAKVMYA